MLRGVGEILFLFLFYLREIKFVQKLIKYEKNIS